MNELEGEKIDIIRYNSDPLVYIANALIPAQVQNVYEIDPESKYAIAVVDDSQLGFAIGQNGVNVKLAKTLCDWLIDVKTKSQYNEMEHSMLIHETVDSLFRKDGEEAPEENESAKEGVSNSELGINEDETPITECGFDDELVKKLHNIDIWSIEEFFEYTNDELLERGLTEEEIDTVRNNVEIVTEEEEAETFECPVCHKEVPATSTVCPHCGAEFEFE